MSKRLFYGSWWNNKIETIYKVTVGMLFERVYWGTYGTPNVLTMSNLDHHRRWSIPKTRIRRTGSYRRRKEQWVYDDFHCMVAIRI